MVCVEIRHYIFTYFNLLDSISDDSLGDSFESNDTSTSYTVSDDEEV